MNIFIEIFIVIGCGALNSWGGYSWHNARRFLMPILLAGEASFIAWQKNQKNWWVGLMVLPVIGTLCLGYPSGKNWGRALWLFLQAVLIGLGLTITHHLLGTWFTFSMYAVLAGVLGGLYKNWWQPLGDFVAGCYLGSIMFFVH